MPSISCLCRILTLFCVFSSIGALDTPFKRDQCVATINTATVSLVLVDSDRNTDNHPRLGCRKPYPVPLLQHRYWPVQCALDRCCTCFQNLCLIQSYYKLTQPQNTLEDVHNLMLAADTTTWDSLADESYIGRIANIGTMGWSVVLDGSYDDAQVCVAVPHIEELN